MARRGAGRFLVPAVFEIRAGDADTYGNPDTVWQVYARRRVRLDETLEGESLTGGVLQSSTGARIWCRRDVMMSRIPTDARVLLQGTYWSIESIAEGDRHLTEERNTLVITLERGPST